MYPTMVPIFTPTTNQSPYVVGTIDGQREKYFCPQCASKQGCIVYSLEDEKASCQEDAAPSSLHQSAMKFTLLW